MRFKKIIWILGFILFSFISMALPLPYLGTGMEHREEIRLRDWFTPWNQSDYNWTFYNIIVGNINASSLNGSLDCLNLVGGTDADFCVDATGGEDSSKYYQLTNFTTNFILLHHHIFIIPRKKS